MRKQSRAYSPRDFPLLQRFVLGSFHFFGVDYLVVTTVYVASRQHLELLTRLQQQVAFRHRDREPLVLPGPAEQPGEPRAPVDGKKIKVVVKASKDGAGLVAGEVGGSGGENVGASVHPAGKGGAVHPQTEGGHLCDGEAGLDHAGPPLVHHELPLGHFVGRVPRGQVRVLGVPDPPNVPPLGVMGGLDRTHSRVLLGVRVHQSLVGLGFLKQLGGGSGLVGEVGPHVDELLGLVVVSADPVKVLFNHRDVVFVELGLHPRVLYDEHSQLVEGAGYFLLLLGVPALLEELGQVDYRDRGFGKGPPRKRVQHLQLAIISSYQSRVNPFSFAIFQMDLGSSFNHLYSKPKRLQKLQNLRDTTLVPLHKTSRKYSSKRFDESAILPGSLVNDSSRNYDISAISLKGGVAMDLSVLQALQQDELNLRSAPPRNRASLAKLSENQHVPVVLRKKVGLYCRCSDMMHEEARGKEISMGLRFFMLVRELERSLVDIVQKSLDQLIGACSRLGQLQRKCALAVKGHDKAQDQVFKLSKQLQRYEMKNSSSMQGQRMASQLSLLLLENTKLHSEVTTLSKSLEESEAHLDLEEKLEALQKKYAEKQTEYEELKYQFRSMAQSYQQFNYKLDAYKHEVAENQACIREKDREIARLQSVIAAKEEEIRTVAKLSRYRQLFYMQREQFQQFKVAYEANQKKQQQLERMIETMRAKISNMIVLVGKQVEIPEGTGAQRRILESLLELIHREEGLRKVMVTGEVQLRYEKLISGKVTFQPILKVEQPIDERLNEISGFRLYHPSFIIFFRQYLKVFKQELRSIQYRQLVPEFFTQMRLILDARQHQFMFASHWREYTSFPDFVYGFFEKFEVDKNYKRITKLDAAEYNPIKKDMGRLNFMLDLLNPKLDEVWEVKTFREFFFESASNEEMYFYLHYRRKLFRGPALKAYFATSSPVIYVEIEFALSLIEETLLKYEKAYLDKIKTAIASKKKLKGSKYVIDGHFVLRTLLELYRLERLNRFIFLQESFKMLNSTIDEEVYIPFRSFKEFVQTNFNFLTYCEIAQIYRQCYALGNGVIKPQIFFMLGSRGFFVRLLKISSPLQDESPAQIQNQFMKIGWLVEKDFKNITDAINYFGVQHLEKDMRRMFQLLQHKKNVASLPEYFSGLPLHCILQNFSSTLHKLTSFLIELNYDLEEGEKQGLLTEQAIKQIFTSFQLCQRLSNPMLCYEQSKKSAGLVLTRYFGTKIFRFYAMLGKKINAKMQK